MMDSPGNRRKQLVVSSEEVKEAERVDRSMIARTSHSCNGSKEVYLRMLQEAIDGIPEKQAYMEAKKRGLVETESDPVSFLMAEAWDAAAAAKRLIAYWEQRQCIFGPVEDSLSLEHIIDRGPLSDGVLVMIPDGKKRAVLCIDESRRKHGFGKEARVQCAFYLLSQLTAIEQEVTILFVLRSVTFEFSGAIDLIRLIREAFPISFQVMHIACLADKESLLQETVLPSLLGALGCFLKLIIKVHVGESKEDLMRQLKAAHFVEYFLPETIGGSWEYTRFAEWQKERRAIETDSKVTPQKRFKVSAAIEDALMKQDPRWVGDMRMNLKGLKQRDTSDNVTLPRDLAGTQSRALADGLVVGASVSLPEKKQVFVCGFTSEKGQEDDDAKRPAVPDDFEDELDKKAEADCSNSSITTDMRSSSEQPVATTANDDDEVKAAMLRRRNALYSKRKYYKKKHYVEGLKQLRYELKTKKQKLKLENRRLERFLEDAQKKVALQESSEALVATRQSSALPLAMLSQKQSLRNMDPSAISSLGQLAPGGMPQLASGPTCPSTGMQQFEANKPYSAPDGPLNQALLRTLLALRQEDLLQRQILEQAESLRHSSQTNQSIRDLIASLVPGAVSTSKMLDSLPGTNASDVAAILAQQQQQGQPPPSLNSSNSIEAQLSLLLSGASQPLTPTAELLAAANNNRSPSSLQGPLARRNASVQQQPSAIGGQSDQAMLLEFLARSLQQGNQK